MSIKTHGGIFGRNPTFNDVDIEGDLNVDGVLTINGNVVTGLDYNGGWNANTNTPDIAASSPQVGAFWIVSTAGSTNLGGITSWSQGDWALYDGSAWQRVEGNTTDLTTAVTGLLPIANGGTNASDAATARQNLDLEVGVDVQFYDAGLTSIAGLSTTADEMLYTTASDTYSTTTITSAGRAILDDADASAQRTTLGLGSAATTDSTDYATSAQGALADSALQSSDIGVSVQGYDADTAKYDATTANFTGTLQEGGNNVVTADEVGTIASQDSNSVNIDGGAIDGVTIGTNSVCTDLRVDNVKIDGSTISTTATNQTLSFVPNGTGFCYLNSNVAVSESGTSNLAGGSYLQIRGSESSGNKAARLKLSQYWNSIDYGVEIWNQPSTTAGNASSALYVTNTYYGAGVTTDTIMSYDWFTWKFPRFYTKAVGATNRDVYVDDTGVVGYVSSTLESKTNVEDLTNVDWIYRLNPVSFNRRKQVVSDDLESHPNGYKYTEEYFKEKELGLIAEQAYSVNGDICFFDTMPNGSEKLAGIQYTKLITPLLKAIQQQKSLIDALEARISALESN